MQKKLRVGWFSFSCSEDSTIVFVEMMNEHYLEWKRLLDFRHARILKSKNLMEEMDVAFIEGAIATEKDAADLRKIRSLCKRLVAVGSCAVDGMPSAQRNDFSEEKKACIKMLVDRFRLAEKVLSVKDVVKVDDFVPGCPMSEPKFMEVLKKYLTEFGVC
ncbi:hypothetical protein HYU11_01845 [Candidatus Woesearchaeota archaeon]|nr:hypothetical protein [Candidatus Woesearchaeota archaeon]